MTNRRRLEKFGACLAACEWADKYRTPMAAWRACRRGDWMLWLLGKTAGPPGSDSRRRLVLVAAECAATALPLIGDAETRAICEAAIQTCYAYACGEAELVDVRSAADAAAYYAAYAAYAASAAAYAASASADADADAAAYYAAAASASARSKALAECADIVRAYYPNPPVIEED